MVKLKKQEVTPPEPVLIIPYFGGFGPPARFRARNNPVDAQNYDFWSNRTHATTPNNLTETTLHFMMYSLGSGLVTLHTGFLEGGMFSSILATLCLSVIVGYCVCVQVWSAQKLYGRVMMSQLSYPDLMEAAVLLSPWKTFRKAARGFRYLVEGTLMIHLYGSCCVSIIMIARNLKELTSGDNQLNDNDYPPVRTVILFLMVPCVLICMLTNLKVLAPFALICALYAICIILTVIWYCYQDVTISPLERKPFNTIMGLFELITLGIFVLEPVSYAMAIENNMAEPKKFHIVVLIAMPILALGMMIMGFFGYWHYGVDSRPPITIHLPVSAIATTLKVFICIILYVIYAVCFYLAFDLEWFYLKRNHQMSNYWFWERMYKAIHVIPLIFICFGMPNVTRLMGFFGSIASTPAIFLYPAIIEVLVDWEYPGLGRCRWKLLKCILFILGGLGIMIAGCYYNVYGMILEWAKFELNLTVDVHRDYRVRKEFTHYYLDLNRTDINYNLTYNNISHGILGYKKGVIPFKTSHVILNNNDTGLNVSHVIRYYNSTSFLPFNRSNILPEYVIPNFNNISLLTNNVIHNTSSTSTVIPNYNIDIIQFTNNTSTVIPNYNNISLPTSNIISLLINNTRLNLPTNNVIILLFNNTNNVIPNNNNVSLLTNNTSNVSKNNIFSLLTKNI